MKSLRQDHLTVCVAVSCAEDKSSHCFTLVSPKYEVYSVEAAIILEENVLRL